MVPQHPHPRRPPQTNDNLEVQARRLAERKLRRRDIRGRLEVGPVVVPRAPSCGYHAVQVGLIPHLPFAVCSRHLVRLLQGPGADGTGRQ